MERIGHTIPSYMAPIGALIAEAYDYEDGMEYAAHFIADENEDHVYLAASHEDVGEVIYYRATVAEAHKLTADH